MELTKQQAYEISRNALEFYEEIVSDKKESDFGGSAIVQLRLNDAFAAFSVLSSKMSTDSDIQSAMVYANRVRNMFDRN